MIPSIKDEALMDGIEESWYEVWRMLTSTPWGKLEEDEQMKKVYTGIIDGVLALSHFRRGSIQNIRNTLTDIVFDEMEWSTSIIMALSSAPSDCCECVMLEFIHLGGS